MQNELTSFIGCQVIGYELEDDCLELKFKQGNLYLNGEHKLTSNTSIEAEEFDKFDTLLCADICHVEQLQPGLTSIEFKTENNQIIKLIFKDIHKDGIVFDRE